jgi:DNA-binding NtrC family response regulator
MGPIATEPQVLEAVAASAPGIDVKGEASERSGGTTGECRPLVCLVGFVDAIDEMLREVLEQEGYRVLSLPLHGDTARLLARVSCDVVLLEEHPLADITPLTQTLHDLPETRDLPLVAMSICVPHKAVRHPGLHYLCMPFELETLLDTVGRLLTQRRRRHRAIPPSGR